MFQPPTFDNYNPFGTSADGEENPWAQKFGNIWSNKPSSDGSDRQKIDPSKLQGRFRSSVHLFPFPYLSAPCLWENFGKQPRVHFLRKCQVCIVCITLAQLCILRKDGFNFKLPDEFNKPTDQMGRFDISPPKNFFENPFASKQSEEKNCPPASSTNPPQSPITSSSPSEPCPPTRATSLPPSRHAAPPCPPSTSLPPCPPSHHIARSDPSTIRRPYTPRNYHTRPSQNRNRFFEQDC